MPTFTKKSHSRQPCFTPLLSIGIDFWVILCYNNSIKKEGRRVMHHSSLRRACALLLLALFLFSFVHPLSHGHALSHGHSPAHAGHDHAGECCAICHVFEHTLLLWVLFFCVLALSLDRAAVRAFVRTRARGRLFYTPVTLKVKLSD